MEGVEGRPVGSPELSFVSQVSLTLISLHFAALYAPDWDRVSPSRLLHCSVYLQCRQIEWTRRVSGGSKDVNNSIM